ncbi:MAG: hypothetical protein JWP01_2628 [Myxococcales bacterium]|nr:hypothetical protein [Myxococcales bacterium]
MNRLAAVVLLVLVSTGCAGRGVRGPVIQRTAHTDDVVQVDHGDLQRPIGQR